MAVKLPEHTWSATALTPSGTKRIVYSTVTGDPVGEVRDGKFVQTVDRIPKPTKKAPRRVTVPETARAGGQEVALANLERDAAFFKGVAENPDESEQNRTRARADYNNLLGDIARLQGEIARTSSATAAKTRLEEKQKARDEFEKLQEDFRETQAKLDALINPNDPKAAEYKRELFAIRNKSKPLYDKFTGSSVPVEQMMDILAGRQTQAVSPRAAEQGTRRTAAPMETPAAPATQARAAQPPAAGRTPSRGRATTAAAGATTRDFEEAATGTQTPSAAPTAGRTDAQIMAEAQSIYGNIDEIFNTNPELKKLIRDAVEGKYTANRFINELEGTAWFKQNAGPIRQRGFYKRQYDELVAGLKSDDPNYQSKIEELNRTSEYGRGLQNAIETVTEEWNRQYGTPTADDLITINTIADEIYRYANEGDLVKIRNAVLARPKAIKAGGVLGGAVGQNLQTLRSIASANGLDLDKDFGTSLQTWTDRLAKGESIETIKSLIRNAAKTTWGVNDRIAGLLDQGVDLATIYSPYRTRMANILEISPETITFSDLASKGVIGGKEEKNLYDFERELRKDSRWQYTRNARQEVSNAALQVLRDFGFQG